LIRHLDEFRKYPVNRIAKVCYQVIDDSCREKICSSIDVKTAQKYVLENLKYLIDENIGYHIIEKGFRFCLYTRDSNTNAYLLPEAYEVFRNYINQKEGKQGFFSCNEVGIETAIWPAREGRISNRKGDFKFYSFWKGIFGSKESFIEYLTDGYKLPGGIDAWTKYLNDYDQYGWFTLSGEDLQYFLKLHPKWQKAETVH